MAENGLDKRFQDEERNAFVKSIADKLYQGIKKIIDADENEKRRWIWELIQNAKDVQNTVGNGKVSIQIELNKNELLFKHNGDPFKLSHLTGLLQQVSTKYGKDADEDITGKFGTGFITTHMISKVIHVYGLLDLEHDYYKEFQLPLDREAKNVEELIEKVKILLELKDELRNHEKYKPISKASRVRNVNSFDTIFKYPLSDSAKKYVAQGIEDLYRCAAYTLLFNELTIESIEVLDRTKNETVKITSDGFDDSFEGFQIFTTNISRNGIPSKERLMVSANKAEKLIVAIPISLNEGKVEICPLPKLTPVLFKDFPLVGTEDFGYSFVINASHFFPTEPRDGVRLHTEDNTIDEEVEQNKSNLLLAKQQLINLIKSLSTSNSNVSRLHFLCKSDIDSRETRNDVVEWLETKFQKPYRTELLNLPIVKTINSYQSISNCLFPIYNGSKESSQKFYEIAAQLIPDSVPIEEDFEAWFQIIKSDTKNWGDNLKYDLEKLIKELHSLKDQGISALQTKNDKTNWYEWLNKLYEFIHANKESNYYQQQYCILPNQNGKFRELLNSKNDLNIPTSLKDLGLTFNKDYREFLLDKIKCPEPIADLTVNEVSNEVNTEIGKTKFNEITDSQLKQILAINLFSSSTSDSTRIKSVKHLAGIFSELNVEIKTDESLKDFRFEPAFKKLIQCSLKRIEKSETTTAFNENYLKKENFDDAIIWLDTFLNLINDSSELKELLNTFDVFPNQNEGLCPKKEIQADKDLLLDNFIKPMFEKLFPKDKITNRLLRDGLDIKLVDGEVTLSWVANEIDTELSKRESQLNDTTPLNEAGDTTRTIFLAMIQWLKKNEATMKQHFKWLMDRKADLFLRTLDKGEDRDNIFRIMISSNDLNKLAAVAESGVDVETITKIVELSKELNLENAIAILKGHPDLTAERIEKLFELEELSKGWDTTVEQPTEAVVIRRNFENGWKGEAFVFKKLKEMNYSVQWANKSETENANVITDYEGEQHFITDKGDKYDLVAQNSDGHNIFVQVKATTTDISRADTIAMPISTREWKFVFETTDKESFYLARVFNVNGDTPEVYFMKLRKPLEL